MGLATCPTCYGMFYTEWGHFNKHNCDVVIEEARALRVAFNLRLLRIREEKEAKKRATEELEHRDIELEQSKLHINDLTKNLAEAYIEIEQNKLLIENMTKVNDQMQHLLQSNKHAQASKKRTIELIST